MKNDYLRETLNMNQDLLQDLTKNQYIQNEFLGVLRSIESSIPEDCRQNFYENLKTLRLNIGDMANKGEDVAGVYNGKSNKIVINKCMLDKLKENYNIQYVEELKDCILMAMYHELLHMASCTRDEKTNYYAGGFQHVERNEDGEFLYSEDLKGMTEGFTEKLTMLVFGKRTYESHSIYGRQMNFTEHLSKLTDLETMKRAYFNNRNGMDLVDKKLEELDGKASHIDLYEDIERDYRMKDNKEMEEEYDKYLLADIERRLLDLSKEKVKELLQENPNMTDEEITDFWKEIAGTINFPEKLELMGENPENYNGLEQLRPMFKRFRLETMENRNKTIQINDIENITQGVKISDLNNEVKNVKKEMQIEGEYNRESLE